MMKKLLLAAIMAVGLNSYAFAQASFTAKDASGATQTFKSFNCSANICSISVPADSTGAAFGVTGNPFFVTNNGTFAVQLSGATNNINNIAGTISLPTGASTAANQSTIISSLATLNTTASNPLAPQSGNSFTNVIGGVGLNATPSIANGNGVVPTQGGTALSATNGGFQNILQGNAALSAANPLPVAPNAYPVGATPITASATGTTAATTATLAGTSGKTTYICSLSVRANATANANVTNTVTGVITGTLSRAMWIPANTAGLGVDEQIYSPCVPASGTNQAIAVVSGAPGTGGVVTVNATGYQQ